MPSKRLGVLSVQAGNAESVINEGVGASDAVADDGLSWDLGDGVTRLNERWNP
jgi:hypothetical protein